jgi:hypothetical protein
MSAKESLTLALRVIGFWVLVSAIGAMTNLVAGLAWVDPTSRSFLISAGFSVIAYAGFAAGLLLFAPAIASWFDRGPTAARPATGAPGLRPRDYYVIGMRLLGVFSILQAIGPAGNLARQALTSRSRFGPEVEWNRAYVVQALSYLACAALLLLGSETVADLFCRSHRESVSSPRGDG